jgi:hypothetical protein
MEVLHAIQSTKKVVGSEARRVKTDSKNFRNTNTTGQLLLITKVSHHYQAVDL